MSRFFDISVPLFTGMVSYPGDAKPSIEPGKQISAGDTSNLSDITLGSHSGTHVDAPRHFIDGERTVDQLQLGMLVGPARVLDLTSVSGTIEAEDLEDAGLGRDMEQSGWDPAADDRGDAARVLLKTTNSSLWEDPKFHKDFVALGNSGADMLVEIGVQLVGIDYLSIERFHPDTYYVHNRLLEAVMIVLEGVDLSGVEAATYELICLPLKIRGGDGAPARAVLREV